MLHKRHNSVVTLTILLTLVGVSKPAKALILAQSAPAAKTFAVPGKLPQDTVLKIAASSSTNGIGASLKESFAAKYPQAKVKIQTQDSVSALKSLSKGQADLAAIGRVLTPAEKAQGFVSVPISREKIAIVVSKNNPFDGNLTIDQFAKIFRGEITDWAEIGGTPGKIQLIDAPNSNDTRQAFPSYPVFQSGEFKTGSTANQLKQDSLDAMIAKLGPNGIGYAVANDVIKRNDVKVITMHQTQPDDPRYPFSEPFNLVYKGTPSKAAQAYLGFAAAQGGKQIIANRVGSISAAAVTATAPGVASDLAGKKKPTPAVQADVNGKKNSAIANGKNAALDTANQAPKAIAGSTDAKAVNNAAKPGIGVNGVDKANKVIANADVNPDAQQSGQVNPSVNDSGKINPDVQQSGQVNPGVNGSGEINPDVQQSGQVNPSVNGSGEINPNVQQSGEPLSSNKNVEGVVNAQDETAAPIAQTNANPGTKVATKKGNWWWWLLPLLGIPLLAAAILGGRKRSDREPALSDISNINNLDDRINPPGSPGGGDVPLGANRAGGLGNVAEATNTSTTSTIGMAGMAAGGAALAGGAAANVAGRRNRTENVAEPDLDLDLDLDESTSVEEIPSNPVSEFTGQETRLQGGDQSTNLQLDNVDVDLDDANSRRIDDISLGDAALGGAVVSRSLDPENETVSDPAIARRNVEDLDTSSRLATEQTTNSTEPNFGGALETDSATTEANIGKEFPGDFVLQEEARNISVPDEVATDTDTNFRDATDVDVASTQDTDLNINQGINNTSVAFPDSVEDVTTADLDLSTDVDPNIDRTGNINGVIAGGAAALGGAAASGIFNRGDRTTEDTDVDAADFDQDTDLSLSDRVEIDTPASYRETADFDQDTDLSLSDRVDNVDTSTGYTETRDISTSDIQEFETFETSFDFSEDTTPTNFADNVIADAETTSVDEVNSLDSLEGITLDNLTDQDDLNLDDITLDNNASLEEITFDDATATEDLSLDEMTLDDMDSSASLEGITFDDAAATEDLSLDEMNFDDMDSSASLEEITFDDAQRDLRLEDITFEDTPVSRRNFVSDTDRSNRDEEINLDDLGFEDSRKANTADFDLLSDNTAEITSLSDNQANDMNNITEWLDSLETPNQDNDNISEWLDTLDKDSLRANPNSAQEDLNPATTTQESDDISFQFLEDLLDRDVDPNRNNQ